MNNQFYKEFNINDEYDYSDFNADLEDYSDEELEDMQDEALDIYNREMDLLAGQDRSEQKITQ